MKKLLLISILVFTYYFSIGQVITPFQVRKTVTQKGGIVFLSNTSSKAVPDNVVQNEMPPSGTGYDNNYTNGYVDIDGDASTWMSSSDQLNLPNCSEITWAGLYWGGDCSTGDENFATRNQVKIKVNSGSYINLTADYLKDNATGFKTYHCYKDITSIMQANGLTDRYTVANVATDVGGKNLFGGWTIVVIYKNNTQNMRNLTVFDGLANVMAGTYSTVDIPISGFQTPLAGPVTFELGLVVYDGDRSLTGDQLLFKGGSAFYNLSNSLHNATDMFNSTISRNGVLTPFRNPSYNNTLGYDANIFSPDNSTKNYIGNNAISAVIRQTTGGETFLTQVVTSAIDVYEPDLRSAVRVKNITHPGNAIAESGDILEYTVNGLNIGSDPSINTFITDTIEGNATYVPGSLKIIYGPNSGNITDAAGDDQGEYIESSKVVRVRIGNGANSALGGLVNNSPTGTDSTQFTFRVQATNDCVYLACDNIIDNSAFIIGTGNVSGNTFDNASNPGIFNAYGCPISGSTKTPINTVGCSAPTASANSPICQGGTINFTASYSPSATYLWTGPNGFSSTLREPSITGVAGVNAGTYTANIYITGTGCHFVYNFNADINIANAGPDQIGSTTCGINTITLAANKPTGTTGSWSVTPTTGASFSDNTSPTSTFTGTPGTTYTLTWTLNSPGCGLTSDDALVLFNPRATSAVLSGTTTLCNGGIANLSVAITGGTSPYSVIISDGSTQTTINNYTSGSNIPVSPTSTKTYTLVSVTDAKGCTPVTISGSAVVTVASQITGTGSLSYSTTATAGPKTATTAADDATSGTLTWSNTGRTVASDNSYTTIAFSAAATSHYLKLTNFGFSLPAGAIISGIEVAIERKNSSTNSSRRTYDNVVEIVGGTGASSNLASATYWSSTEGTYTYGGSTNLWGRTDWTYSQINSSSFGIRLQIKRTGTSTQSTTASVDYVTVKIYYQTTSFCDDASGIGVAVTGLTNVTNYLWTPPAGGMIITGQNTNTGSATFDLNNAGQSGSYNVCVTPTNGCQTASQICLPISVTNCANTAISIVGNVFWDTNLADNIINGTGIGKVGTTQLYVTLVNNSTNVAIGNSYTVNTDGSYRFTGVTAGTTYKLYLGTTSYTNGSAVPVPPTPTLYTWTGEIVNNLLNTLVGNDNTIDGMLSVTPSASISTVNANFGIKMITPPVANADTKIVNEDNNAVIDVTANDTDADGTINKTTVDLDPSTAGIQSTRTTTQGTWTANTTTGVVTLVPTVNYSGVATINYTVKDNDGNVSNTTAITVIINPVNDAPVGTSNTVTTQENKAFTFSEADFKFDIDPESDALTSITIATLPSKGTLKLSGVDITAGQSILITDIPNLTFEPATNESGTAYTTFTYKGSDADLGSVAGTMTINVTHINVAPVAVNDAATTDQGLSIAINVLSNDINVDGTFATGSVDLDPYAVGQQTSFTIPGQGTFADNGSGVITFTPIASFFGTTTTIYYTVQNSFSLTSNKASIVVTVVPAGAPTANNDNATTNQNVSVSIDVTSNDVAVSPNTINPSRVDLDPLTAGIQQSFEVTGKGQFSVDMNGLVTFVPEWNFNGVATVDYTVRDNANLTSNVATITVTVNWANTAPFAVDDVENTNEDTPISFDVTTNDYDLDDAVAHGNAGLINVASVDLDPTTLAIDNSFTVANEGTYTVNSTGIVTFTPVLNFNGTATQVAYSIQDKLGLTSDLAYIILTVNAVNDAPVAVNDANSTAQNTAVSINVTTNDTDVDGTINPSTVDLDPSTAGIQTTLTVSGQGTYTVNSSGVVTFTPLAAFYGFATPISYTVNDNLGLTSASGTLSIEVIQSGTAPIATNDVVPAINEGSTSPSYVITTNDSGNGNSLVLNTIDLDQVTAGYQASVTTTDGTWTVNTTTGGITFVPSNVNYNGTTSISYTIDDNLGNTSNVATITITVNSVNDAPSFVKGANQTVCENSDAQIVSNWATSLSTGPTDESSQTLSFVVTNDNNSLFTIQPSVDYAGNLSYTPATGVSGSATVSVKITDDGGTANGGVDASSVQTFIITINPLPNSALTLSGSTVNIGSNGSVTINSAVNGVTYKAFIGTTQVASGTGAGSNLVLTVNSTYLTTGSNTITFTADNGTCSSAMDNSAIIYVNTAPVSVADSYSVNEGTTLTVNSSSGVLSNDTDVDANTLTAIKVTNPSHGTLTLNADGSFTYVHDGSETTSDSFTYKSNDGYADGNTVTVTITINPLNDAPVAVADSYTVAEGGTLNILAPGVLSNDTDAEGNTLTAIAVTYPLHGTLSMNADGSFTYVHDGSETTSDSFTYKVNDGSIDGNTVTVTITVTPVNDAPVAVDDSYTVNEGGTLSIVAPGLLANDTDAEGDGLTAVKVSGPSHGTLTLNANGSFTYIHDGSETTTDSYTYKVFDGTDYSNVATVSITINPVNDAPVAVADSYTVAEGGTLNISAPGVLSNDTDAESDPLTAIKVSGPSNGTLTLNADGSFTYVHDGSETTSDSFTYKANDGTVDGNTVTVTIIITPVNDAPVAVADSYTVNEGATLTISAPGLLANDTDAEGDGLTAIKVSDPLHGTLTLNADGSFTYVHDGSETTSDSYTYKVFDGAAYSNVATVNISVTPVNDPPIAADNTIATPKNTDKVIQTSIFGYSDIEGDALTLIKITALPTFGTLYIDGNGNGIVDAGEAIALNGTIAKADIDAGKLKFKPVTNASGIPYTTFDFKVNDGTDYSVNAYTITINVTITNSIPVAVDDNLTLNEDESKSIDVAANDTNLDDGSLVVSVTTIPQHGTYSISGTTVTYTPNPNYNGSDSFVYQICDGNGDCSSATVYVTVNPVNDSPIAVNDAVTINEDGTATGNLLTNDSDPDGDPLTINTTPVVGPIYGTLVINSDGTFTYTPDSNYNGTDTFTYEVCDNHGACSQATVTITINAVNDKPNAVDDTFIINEDGTATGNLLANDSDPEGDPLTINTTPVSGPTHGTVVINSDGTFTYTPDPNYNGTDSFTYEVCDNNGACSQATVTITINAVNDKPNAVNDSFSINEDGTATGNLLANDSDPEGDPLTINTTPVVAPTHGTVVINSDGTFTYTPDPNYNGTDSFTYEVCDNHGACSQATVTITINAVNDKPNAVNDTFIIDEDGTATGNLLANDSDPEGDPLTINTTPVVAPTHGTVVINSDGTFTYTPDPNFNGTDSFTYEVCDDNGACSQATVTITINAVNDAPVAVADSYSTLKAASLTISAANGVLKNDTDVDNDPLTAILVSNVSHGILTLNADGSFTYIHDGSNTTSDSFTYKVNDGTVDGNTVTVTITINSVNTAPVAVDDSYSVVKGNTLAVNQASGVLNNDTDAEGNTLTAALISTTSHGTLTLNADGSFTYINDGSSATSDSFTYKVNDGFEDGNIATVTITITTVNSAPVAVNDSYTVAEGATLSINAASGVLSNDTDADSDALTAIKVTNPTHGTLTLNSDGSFTYVHDGSETTSDSFTYKVNDGTVDGNTATVTITITPVNDLPVAVADSYSVNEGETLNVSAPGVLTNDTDAEGGTLTAIKVTNPSHGSLTFNSNGSFTYVHDGSETTNDSFTYKVNDGTSDGNTVTVTITINPVNDLPFAVNDVNSINEGEAEVSGNILANDTDAENNTLQVYSINGSFSINSIAGSYGTLTCNSNGDYTYTLDNNNSSVVALNDDQTLTETFTYKATDGTGESNSTTLVITINGKSNDEVIVVPEGFSPDGDGINDHFVIDGLDNYPENELVVFNRWGTEVYHKKNYNNEWNGRSSVTDSKLPVGTYFYVLTVKGKGSAIKGFVYLKY